MTRKRFIKILMSEGMQRNEASDCAELTRDAENTYCDALESLLLLDWPDLKFASTNWVRIRNAIIYGSSEVRRFFEKTESELGMPII